MTPTSHTASKAIIGHQDCTRCGLVLCREADADHTRLCAPFQDGATVVQTGPRSFTDARLYTTTGAPWGEVVACKVAE